MDRPAPEFDDHPWGPPPPPPNQFQDRDFPPPHAFNPGENHRHSNRHVRRHDHQHADDYRGVDDEQFNNHYSAPPDEWFGTNGGELGHGHGQGQSRPHHLPRKRRAAPYDYSDGENCVKLFVGGVTNTVTEEDVRLLFEEYGSVVEVVLSWDKWTGYQKEFCFVKYASFEEADNAIKALHDQYIWPGTAVPLRVKYADTDKKSSGTASTRQKVYVNGLNKQASKEEIAEIFAHYGEVEEVYIMLDDCRQSRGCGFIGFSHRDMALAAIEGLNGSYVMRGCERPLVVRFADPKKPRQGELRSAPCGNTGTSPAALHIDNLCPSAENAFIAYGGTPVNGALHEPSPYQRIQPQDSQAINLSLRSASKPQPAINFVSDKTNNVLQLPQVTSDGASGTAVVEGTPNCDWSEHVSPDGYKYYYNCMTFESRLSCSGKSQRSLPSMNRNCSLSLFNSLHPCFVHHLSNEHIHEKVQLERSPATSPPVV